MSPHLTLCKGGQNKEESVEAVADVADHVIQVVECVVGLGTAVIHVTLIQIACRRTTE